MRAFSAAVVAGVALFGSACNGAATTGPSFDIYPPEVVIGPVRPDEASDQVILSIINEGRIAGRVASILYEGQVAGHVKAPNPSAVEEIESQGVLNLTLGIQDAALDPRLTWSTGELAGTIKIRVVGGSRESGTDFSTDIEVPAKVILDCDADLDGADSLLCGGADCDETQDDIYGGAPEVCDGIDNDCDEQIDEDC